MAWMAVSEDKKTAVVGWYRILNAVNGAFTRVKLEGLCGEFCYENSQDGSKHYGDELMNFGLITSDATAGQQPENQAPCTDYESRIYVLKAIG